MSAPESEADPLTAMSALRQLSAERGTPRFDAAVAEVELAIAAEAAQHRQAMKRQTDDFNGLCDTIQSLRARLAVVEAERGRLRKILKESCRRNVKVRAERDAAHAEVQTVAKELMDALNEPMYAGSRDDWRFRAQGAEAERDRLKAAAVRLLNKFDYWQLLGGHLSSEDAADLRAALLGRGTTK